MSFGLAFSVAFAVSGLQAWGQGSPQLTETIRKLDAASAKFQSAEADLHRDIYERVVRETTTQVGSVYFIRKGAATQMGLKILPPYARVVEYKDGKVKLYDPGANHLQVIAAAENQAKFETFFTLGFGGSGQDLLKAWTVDDQGSESLTDGKPVKVEKLVLVPKDPSVKGTFTQVTLWMDLERGVALKQEFIAPSGDKQTATYLNIKYNRPVDLKVYEIKCKGSCS
ncbi:outer membrane lipoprotein-sorting protein [Granulicella sp. dw_53]|uniref:LolA family protein n=1 Tax=Granulicella sp. dw_53 TaxID=2719792 RepID=UPI001BD2C000|nr:outer membrane lipoprotein-sorting protein [Granulicella sp. dw_53]